MGQHVHALDSYCPRESLVHRLDARVKVILVVLFIVATVLTPDGAWWAYMLQGLLALGVVLASRLGVGFVQRRSLLVLPFVLAAVTVAFATPGRPLWEVRVLQWGLVLTDAGLVRFASILCRSWLSMQMAVVLAASTPFPALLGAMRSLRLPRVLVAIAGFAYRYLFVIGDEALRLMRARVSRSGVHEGRGGGGVLWRARVTGGMAGSLFLRSLERSERIYAAMRARGYDGEVRLLHAPALRPGDVVAALPFVMALVVIQVLARR